jgi:hypothetical protein
MSEARFYVSEITGFDIREHGSGGNRSTHVYIHDRAYCHRIVRTWTKHGAGVARERAELACARLNLGLGRSGPWPRGVPRP